MAVAPNPIDLTTLAAVKAWLGANAAASDDALQQTITNCSRAILTFLSRNVLPADYSERYDGAGWPSSRLMLKQWPVISIAQVSIGNTLIGAAAVPGPNQQGSQSGYLLSPGDSFPPGAQQFLDFPGYGTPRGSQNIGVSYRAGYATSESWQIPTTPYQITPTALYGRWAMDLGVTIAGVAAAKVASAPVTGQYAVSATGVYTFAAADAGKAAVISYGYVPQDLEQAALEWISFRYVSRASIGVNSKSLGGQETISYSAKDMPSPVAMMLQNYRRVF